MWCNARSFMRQAQNNIKTTMFPEEGSLQYSFLKIDRIFSHFVVVVDRLHASLNDGMKLQTS